MQFPADKRAHYSRHLVHMPAKDLSAFQAAAQLADQETSEVYDTALRAALAKGEEAMVLMAPIAAEKFMQALQLGLLPSCEAEERIWGLWGEPSSPGYQRVLLAYHKACTHGDLTATKLMECLCARPHASKALTDLLHNTRFVCTEDDCPDIIMRVIDDYLDWTQGLQVNSEFDRWPVTNEPLEPTAAAASNSQQPPNSSNSGGAGGQDNQANGIDLGE